MEESSQSLVKSPGPGGLLAALTGHPSLAGTPYLGGRLEDLGEHLAHQCELASRQVALGAATTVLLTTGHGVLAGTMRLPAPEGGVWTPDTLRSAIYHRLDRATTWATTTDGYQPTAGQTAFVQARHPRCAGYDCARISTRCDLDHATPWPRGPTSTGNLAPRCRRHHEQKTRGLLHVQLNRDGTLTTTTLTGLAVTTRPEPLPGYGPGEPRPWRLDRPVADDTAA